MYSGSIQGTMFRRESGVWYGNYFRNGRRVKVSLGTTDKRIASRRLQELLAHPSDRSILFTSVLDEILQDMRIRRLKSLKSFISHSQSVRLALGTYRIGDITEKVIREFVRKSLSEGLANATVNRRLHIISQTLKVARSQGYISFIPHIQRLSEAGNARQGFFTDEEIQRLLPHLPEWLRDFTLFAYLTGWRKSECASIKWSMVHWANQVILLPTSKNSEPRVLPLVGELWELIQRRHNVSKGEFIFHREGHSVNIKGVKAWNRACEKAGLGHRLFHDTRRSALKNAIASGLSETLPLS